MGAFYSQMTRFGKCFFPSCRITAGDFLSYSGAMQKALVWVRRDLRLTDHAPLAHAASLADTVAVAFVFDRKLLAGLRRADRRLTFIHQSLEELDAELQKRGSRLIVRIGDP